MIFNFNDLPKKAKIGYNTLYNVVLSHSTTFNPKTGLNKFTVPLCLNADKKVSLTEKNFIFFDSVLQELNLNGYYSVVENKGRAVEEIKTDFFTVEVTLSKNKIDIPSETLVFDFSDVDTSKLIKRDGKAERAKTAENKVKEENEKKEAEKTSKELEEKNAEVEMLKKEVAKKDEQLNKMAIAEFNDDALFTIADCVEVLIKKHCPIPAEFDFSSFENDLFKVIKQNETRTFWRYLLELTKRSNSD